MRHARSASRTATYVHRSQSARRMRRAPVRSTMTRAPHREHRVNFPPIIVVPPFRPVVITTHPCVASFFAAAFTLKFSAGAGARERLWGVLRGRRPAFWGAGRMPPGLGLLSQPRQTARF
jgi:hypothetical protein